jgi:hypothetical protein
VSDTLGDTAELFSVVSSVAKLIPNSSNDIVKVTLDLGHSLAAAGTSEGKALDEPEELATSQSSYALEYDADTITMLNRMERPLEDMKKNLCPPSSGYGRYEPPNWRRLFGEDTNTGGDQPWHIVSILYHLQKIAASFPGGSGSEARDDTEELLNSAISVSTCKTIHLKRFS